MPEFSTVISVPLLILCSLTCLKNIFEFKLESDLALWVVEFLVGRSQQVRVIDTMSSVKVVSTGTPQGCVLSPPIVHLVY